MKFQHHEQGDAVEVKMSGRLEVSSCSCLENFWALRVTGHRTIRIDVSDVIEYEPEAVALLARLLSEEQQSGADLLMAGVPDFLAGELSKLNEQPEDDQNPPAKSPTAT